MMKQFLPVLLAFTACATTSYGYWQQHVATKIEATLDDRKHMVYGYEELEYTNNSPDTLRYIYMHLWPNAYKNDHTPFARQMDHNGKTDFYYSRQEDKGYIDSLQFMVDGLGVAYNSSSAAPDIARLELNSPLMPGGKIKISTPFRVKLPLVFSRSGHTGQAYYVSQWFPKPAVYDSKGWHPISYMDQGEFYSEFGSYDVRVTVPRNYVVMATGNCVTPDENKWMDSLAALPLPADTLYRNWFPESALTTKTLRFKEDNIHDFAWFADKRFVVRKDTVYNPGEKQPIISWSAFLPVYQASWQHANEYLATAVGHYGKWVGPYPYKTIKAVLGDMKSGGGMEYPTITLIDRTATGSKLKTVVVHEAGHNWFYGMLGTNERQYAWMDEGINSFYEQKTIKASGTDSAKARRKNALDEGLLYYEMAATGQDQAINTHSEQFRNMTVYGIDVYYKTALMLGWLEAWMGPGRFEEAMHAYFDQWKYKHPYPNDLKAIMDKYAPANTDWFFDTILNTDKKIDYTIKHARNAGNDETTVTVKNVSGVAAPALVTAYAGDSAVASGWTAPFETTATVNLPTSDWTRIAVDAVVPDARSANDVYRRHGLFHRFGLHPKPVLGINRSSYEKLFIAPAIGNNAYDGTMAGLLLHNLTIPENRFAYALAPMYSFRTGTFVAAGSVGYTWYTHGLFKEIALTADAKTFHMNETSVNMKEAIYARYLKVAPAIQFTFRERDPMSTVTRSLRLKQYTINEDIIDFGADSTAIPELKATQNLYADIRYQHSNKRTYNPFSYTLDGHGNKDFIKLGLEGRIRVDYFAKGKALHVRGYLGKFIALNNDPAATNRYLLNASYGGRNDYLYDGTYRGRNVYDNFSGQQISAIQEGGFKVPVNNGAYRSDNWIAAVNLKTDLPKIKLPIRLFLDAGLVPNPSPSFKNIKNTRMLYDGGVEVWLSKDIVSFYFPIIMSDDFRNYLNTTFGSKNAFAHSISFTLHLENIDWLKTPGRVMRSVLK